eukprot:INCI5018.4.p2 GENE.INCI5018.4~~INCI5018.4.p2  ORF type:complete len:101 (+),score=14.41 INCI5018.4:969-1271(+)
MPSTTRPAPKQLLAQTSTCVLTRKPISTSSQIPFFDCTQARVKCVYPTDLRQVDAAQAKIKPESLQRVAVDFSAFSSLMIFVLPKVVKIINSAKQPGLAY